MFEVAPAIGSGANYQIKNSLRFNAPDSAYMSRTFTSIGTATTFTFSCWTKIKPGVNNELFCVSPDATSSVNLIIYSGGNMMLSSWNGSTRPLGILELARLFRDPSAWYHIVAVVDTTNATASDRLRLYINGVRETSFTANVAYPAQNATFYMNGNFLHCIGRQSGNEGAAASLTGYLAEANFIDGQALTPSSFGKTDSTTGQWIPKKYTGTYGTNGFYLPFDDGTSTTTLGYDRSGNGNNWTLTNFTRSAGVNDDWMQDTPTNNYCTLNPLCTYGANTITDGALKVVLAAAAGNSQYSSMAMSSGKYYWEVTPTQLDATYQALAIGISRPDVAYSTTLFTNGVAYYCSNGHKYVDGVDTVYGAGVAVNAVVGVALDCDNSTIEFFNNSVSQGSISIPANQTWMAAASNGTGSGTQTLYVNFGQRAFAYTPPTGFKALCTKNLPTPTIKNGKKYFGAVLHSTNGGASQVFTGMGFQADMLWSKSRANAYSWLQYDSSRGVSLYLSSNATTADTSYPTGLLSIDADGFTLGSGFGSDAARVMYGWKAGGSPVTNTNGTITSQVSANVAAGFSIVTYTGTGANATVGHGLGVAPKMIISKSRNNLNGDAGYWDVYHSDLTSAAYYIQLHTTSAQTSAPTVWNSTAPSSTVYSVGTASGTNAGTSATYVAYCFAEVPGYSKIGKYTGNGSADGPFVFCGFKPKYLLIKRTDTAASWYLTDGARDLFNEEQSFLYPNLSNAEGVGTAGVYREDFLSNGFKIRGNGADINASGGTYIFMAFAEAPFKYSTAK